MKIKGNRISTLITASILSLCFISHALAESVDTRKNLPKHDMIFTKPQDVKSTPDALSQNDIKRFVTVIAIVHRYYIKKVGNNKLFNNAIKGMVSSLDPHSTYLTADDLKQLRTTVSGKFVGIGIELTLKNGLLKVVSPLDGSPAQRAGIKPNDYIIKVGNTLVRDMSLSEAISKIKGRKGTQVKLTILRKGADKPLVFQVTRETIKLVSVKSRMLEKGFGYVHLTFFQGPVETQMHAAIEKLKKQSGGKLKGLVLDLRNNPGGLLDVSTDVANDFLDSTQLKGKYKDYIVYTKGRAPGANMHITATPKQLIPGTPMVVLINGGSASASEIVAGALQDYNRAVIMGTRSFGKGSVQTVLPVTKDSAIKLTTALYYTPAGRTIQAKGIIPNVTVPALKIASKAKANQLQIDESDFQHHLQTNGKTKPNQSQKELRKQMLAKQLSLAEKDYQLYQALVMLKGLSSSN